MAAFSQLAEFARSYRQGPSPGVEIVVTPNYQLQLMPDFPIPGPNNVSWIRCHEAEVEAVIREAQATAAARNLRLVFTLDPDTRPADLGERLVALGLTADDDGDKSAVMVLPATAELEPAPVDGLVIKSGLEDLESFTAAERVAEEAFGDVAFGAPSPIDAQRERRFANYRATVGRHIVLATLDGEPAGSGSMTVLAPDGAMMNGGAVRPRFRGRGVYRAMVAARLRIAREAGAAGLFVWAGHMSRPILTGLGFEAVSWRRFYR
jgi:GNAT superfamily N-acetyltransferase